MHLKKFIMFVLISLSFGFVVLDKNQDLVVLADEEFNYRYQLINLAPHEFLEVFCPHLEKAIRLYWEALDQDASEKMFYLLFQLTRGYYELAACCNSLSVKRVYFEKGITYGRKWIEEHLSTSLPEFSQAEFRAYIRKIDDPGILFWLAQNFGGYLEAQGRLGDVTVLNNIGTKVANLIALYKRSIELDPDYFGANALSSLGSLLVFLPSFLGGDFYKGIQLLERAKQTHPEFLYNQILYIKSLYFKIEFLGKIALHEKANKEKVREELWVVINSPLGEFPFWNALAQKEAERLLKEIQKIGR